MIYRKVYSCIGTLVLKVDISLNVGDLGAEVFGSEGLCSHILSAKRETDNSYYVNSFGLIHVCTDTVATVKVIFSHHDL